MTTKNEQEAEILRLHHAERWPIGTIARQVDVHPSVVRRVLRQANAIEAAAKPRASKVDVYLPYIHEVLERWPKLHASRIFQMVRARGYSGGESYFREIIAGLRPRPKAEAYLRLRTLPGEQAQVDWGDFGALKIGRARRRLFAFVMVLSWSRRIYLRFFVDARTPSFLSGHVMAFERVGGVPRVLLYDNLKSAVIERRGPALRLNETMLELARHYHFEPRACAPRRGNEKGRVERAIRYIRGSFFAGREVECLDDLNAQAEAWCDGTAMDRRWVDDPSRTVREVFEEERPRLLALPEQPFPCEERVSARVGKTPYVRFDLNDYSVPHTEVQREVEVLASLDRVRIIRGAELLAEHRRTLDRGERVEDPAHVKELVAVKTASRQHRATERLTAQAPSSEAFLVNAAARGQNLGGATSVLMRTLDEYGASALERALVAALAKGIVAASAVRHMVIQESQTRPPPLVVALDDHPKLAAVVVHPHALGDYDRLGEIEDGEEVDDGEG
ncbi:MAG: IS21 family transposase [Nannocystis sp.]|nr:IS21 family transposase [Nannocystis sp.]